MFFSPSVLFWFGDLNFRIEDYDIHVVKCAIDSNKLPLLWERDQVRHLHRFKKNNSVSEIFLHDTSLSLQHQIWPAEDAATQIWPPPPPLCTPQLNMAKSTESILEGFNEGPLKFPPTYKFDVGTHTYDTRFVRCSALILLQCILFWQSVALCPSLLLFCQR